MHMSMKGRSFDFSMDQIKTTPEDSKHYLCTCKGFELPPGIDFARQDFPKPYTIYRNKELAKEVLVDFGLAAISVTINVTSDGCDSPASGGYVIIFEP